MRLTSISLDNFRSHVSTTLELKEPITLIAGHLNSGKSSVAAAIEYALTGQIERYRKTNCAFTDLVHDQKRNELSRFVVTLTTDRGTIKRGRGMTGPAFCSFNDKADGEAAAMTALGTTKTVLSTLLQTGDFFEKETKEQKEMVLKLLGAEVTTKAITEAFPADKKAFTLLTVKEFTDLQSLDNAYQEAYKLREGVNRERKQMQPAEPPKGERPLIEDVKKQIAARESERTAKLSELGAARAALGKPSIRPALERQLKEYADWLAAHGTSQETLDAMDKELAAAKESYAAAVKTHTAEYEEARALLVQAEAENLVHSKNHDILMKFNGKCVVGQHECPATREQMGKAKDEEHQLAKVAAGAAKVLKEKVALMGTQVPDRSAIAAVEGRMATAKLDIAEYDRKERLEDELEKQLAELKDEASGDPATGKTLELAIAQLDSNLATGRKVLENAQSWLFREAEVKRVAEARASLERKLAALEALVEFFGPKGIKVKLITEKLAIFSDLVNDGCKSFGFEFGFSAEPWQITAKGRPVDSLSRSERFRLGVALQVAIAKATGIGCVVVDNAEHLTPDAKGQLFGLLKASGVQAIVVMTSMASEAAFKAKPPKMPGVQVLWVKNENGISKVEVV